MRLLFKVCAVALVAAFVVSSANAQRPGGFGGRFGGGGLETLLTNKSVQDELKIGEEQAKTITEAITKFREANKDDYDKLRSRDTSMEDRAEIRKKLSDKFNAVAKDVVKPEQMKRIKQIQLQQQGVAAFSSEEIQKQLKFTDEQTEKVKTLGEDLRKDVEELRRNATGGNIQELFTKMRELTKEAGEKVQKVLTDDQKKAWKEMTGEPFQMRFERQPGRPGGTERPGRPGGDPKNPPKKVDF